MVFEKIRWWQRGYMHFAPKMGQENHSLDDQGAGRAGEKSVMPKQLSSVFRPWLEYAPEWANYRQASGRKSWHRKSFQGGDLEQVLG
jgi:hypothetical protein